MANIGIRSPYFIYKTQATAVSAKVEVTIAGTLEYTIVKNTGTFVRLDISELVRDFVIPTYDGTLSTDQPNQKALSIAVQFYSAANATGDPVGSIPPESHVAYDGYGYFSEGEFEFDDKVLLSSDTIWMPDGVAGSFFRVDSGVLSVVSFSTSATSSNGVTIKRQPCDKYDPIKAAFINKFGVPQEIYFFAKRVDSISASGEKYISGAINIDGSYSITSHQYVSFDRNAKRSYSLSTGYVNEAYNNYIQEMLLSEMVWLTIDNVVKPVSVVSSGVQYKTSLNDKLVSYTMEFEEANDLISTVR